VIKKLVFDDKKVSLARLCEALDKNFEGEDEPSAPHQAGAEVRERRRLRRPDGQQGASALGQRGREVQRVGRLHVHGGRRRHSLEPRLRKAVGALPDGRKAGTAALEGGISPYQGRNTSGPTSTMRSVAKLDLARASGGAVLNMRFNPDGLKDETKMMRFAQMPEDVLRHRRGPHTVQHREQRHAARRPEASRKLP